MALAHRHRLALQAVLDGVLDERLEAQEGQGDRQDLGGDLQGDGEAVTEACPHQRQIVVDGVELVGEGGEVAVSAERVAGEVGEFQEQFAGAFGVGAHERGDHRERVEDEVRGYLGAQGLDLGLDEAGAGLVEVG